ncbi:SDR family NAD(P)-dependent oxidoreductase [Streptomyces nanshensis]|uniref:3-oxoacyl-ACP reductase n=1 Tax=Streptomyces nanshensis TaxID=518642 RepID=A0A1E7KZK1_9ACTN|nr:SDR family oxidoreductase [Streptomyces nanshensis]OEV09233.1 3-oxoacyl-ACP reductase [Streptomyces nanshensis]
MSWGLAGRRILVAGGTRGIGGATVELLLREGCAVALCGRRKRDVEAAARDGEVFARSVDVTIPDAVEDFTEEAVERLGGLDGVVACAGGGSGGGIEEASRAQWTATFEANTGYSARLLGAAAAHLRAAGGGSAVLVASISGWKPGPQAQYGAAKAAQISMAATLARELGRDGTRVNAVSPGSTLVPGKRWDGMRTEQPEEFAAFTREFPGGRLIQPQEVAEVIVFLLSDRSSGISGANIPVDRAQNAPTPFGY